MPIRMNSIIIRDGLLEEISRVKSLPDDTTGNPNQESLKAQLEKIEQELRSRRNMFPVGNRWDELVIQKFDALEQDVADDKVKDYSPEDMKAKINRMNDNLEKLNKILDASVDFSPSSESSTTASYSKDRQKQQPQTKDDWERCNIEKNVLESGAMTVLQSSYHNLKDHLKLCLLCFSVFPKKWVIKKRPLIYWWIGEGFVTNADSKTAEMEGEDVLQELQKNGFIKPWLEPGAPRPPQVTSYEMHPWIHRMVISVARKAGLFDFEDNGNVTPDSGHMSRRVRYVQSEYASTSSNSGGVEKLGSHDKGQVDDGSGNSRHRPSADSNITLFNVNKQYLNIDHNWFSRQKSVRVLQLGRWQNSATYHIEVEDTKFLLQGLGTQKHLQYLSLRGLSRITELPESVAKLTALKILDLRACHNLENLPSGIKAMKMLTHLDVSECYLLEQMPKGLGALSHLQVLKGFVLGNSRSSDPCRLKDLAKLETLRKLSIIVGRDADIAQELVNLQQFKNLRILNITWGVTKSSGASDTQSLSSTLSLPPNLEKLDLRCFPEKHSPTWLRPSMLINLKRLYIRGGQLESLSNGESEERWNVETLRLKFLRDLEIQWSSLHRVFPRLQYLEKKECCTLQFPECDEHGIWVKNTQT